MMFFWSPKKNRFGPLSVQSSPENEHILQVRLWNWLGLQSGQNGVTTPCVRPFTGFNKL